GRLDRARLIRLHAEIAFARRRGRDAPPLLFAAAKRLEPLDAALARETHLDALGAAIFAGRLGGEPGVAELAAAARAAPPGPGPPRAVDLLLDGVARRLAEDYVAGLVPLRRALAAVRREAAEREAAPPEAGRPAVAGWPGDAAPPGTPARRATARSQGEDVRWHWLACRIAAEVWDDAAWEELAERQVRVARDSGALAVLPLALTYRSGTHLHAGEFAA